MAVKKGVDGAVKKHNIDIASFSMAPGEVWRQGSGVPVGRIVSICVEIVYPQKRLLCGLFIAVFCIFAADGSRGAIGCAVPAGRKMTEPHGLR